MASFKICVRVKRHDGLYPVYIRITHDRQIGYIKTDKCVGKEGLKWKFRRKVVPFFRCERDPLFRLKVTPWS